MKKTFLLAFWLTASLAVHSQYVSEDVINSERFGHVQLYFPSAVAIAPNGSIYLLEYSRHQIKVLNQDGSLQKVIKLSDDVVFPYCISIDTHGTLYVGAQGQVLVFNNNGNFLRSFGSLGSNEGQFNYVVSIAIDPSGKIYALDSYNFRVGVFDNQGNYLYQIDNLDWSYSLAVGQDGVLYVAEYSTGMIKKFYNGQLVGIIPAGYPYYVAVDHLGNLVVQHFFNDNEDGFYVPKLSRYTPQGNLISSMSGLDFENSNMDTQEYTYLFDYGSITTDNQNHVYLIDTYTNRILKVNIELNEITEIVRVDHTGQTNLPGDIEIDNAGNVYSVDEINDRIQAFEFNGNYKSEIDLGVPGFGSLPYGYKIAIDQNNWKFVLKPKNAVSVYDDQNQLSQEWTFDGTISIDLTVDNDHVYILKGNEPEIRVFSKDGDFQRVIDLGEIERQETLDIDQFGNLIVTTSDQVQIFANDGTHIRNLGDPSPNLFNGIKAVTVDGTGNIYVAETSNVKIFDSSDNLVQQIGGYGTELGMFDKIEGLAVGNGRLYVSDQYNNRIQIFSNLESPPSLVMGDVTTNYINSYFNVQAFTDSQHPIKYQVVSGTAALFITDQVVFLNHAGEVTIEATIDGTPTQRKAVVRAKLIVEKAQLTVTADDKTRTYGYDNPQLTAQITGLRAGDYIWQLDELPLSTTLATPFSNAATYDITPIGGLALNYEFDYEPGHLTIGKASLVATAENVSRTYGDENPELPVSYVGFMNSDNYADIDSPPVVSTDATIDSPTGEYSIELHGGSDNNYNIDYTWGALTIEKAPLTITAENKSKIYGESNPVLSASYSGFKNDDTFLDLDAPPQLSTSANQTSHVGDYSIVASNALDINYNVTYAPGVLKINKALLTVKAEDKSRVFNTANPELTIGYTGFKNNENKSNLNIEPSVNTSATQSSSVGQYDIVAGGAVATDYEFAYVNGKLTITKANQLISFESLPSPILNTRAPITLQASANSGLPLNYAVSGPASVSSSMLTLSGGLGTVNIEVSQPGNENYFAAAPVSRSFEVILDPVLGIDEDSGNIKIYPNPAKEELFIESPSVQILEVSLIDAKGMEINLNEQHPMNQQFFVDVSAIPSGLYVLRMKTNQGQYLTRKIAVVK